MEVARGGGPCPSRAGGERRPTVPDHSGATFTLRAASGDRPLRFGFGVGRSQARRTRGPCTSRSPRRDAKAGSQAEVRLGRGHLPPMRIGVTWRSHTAPGSTDFEPWTVTRRLKAPEDNRASEDTSVSPEHVSITEIHASTFHRCVPCSRLALSLSRPVCTRCAARHRARELPGRRGERCGLTPRGPGSQAEPVR